MTNLMLIKFPFMSISSEQRGLSQAAFNLLIVTFITFFMASRKQIAPTEEPKQEGEINCGA